MVACRPSSQNEDWKQMFESTNTAKPQSTSPQKAKPLPAAQPSTETATASANQSQAPGVTGSGILPEATPGSGSRSEMQSSTESRQSSASSRSTEKPSVYSELLEVPCKAPAVTDPGPKLKNTFCQTPQRVSSDDGSLFQCAMHPASLSCTTWSARSESSMPMTLWPKTYWTVHSGTTGRAQPTGNPGDNWWLTSMNTGGLSIGQHQGQKVTWKSRR